MTYYFNSCSLYDTRFKCLLYKSELCNLARNTFMPENKTEHNPQSKKSGMKYNFKSLAAIVLGLAATSGHCFAQNYTTTINAGAGVDWNTVGAG